MGIKSIIMHRWPFFLMTVRNYFSLCCFASTASILCRTYVLLTVLLRRFAYTNPPRRPSTSQLTILYNRNMYDLVENQVYFESSRFYLQEKSYICVLLNFKDVDLCCIGQAATVIRLASNDVQLSF